METSRCLLSVIMDKSIFIIFYPALINRKAGVRMLSRHAIVPFCINHIFMSFNSYIRDLGKRFRVIRSRSIFLDR